MMKPFLNKSKIFYVKTYQLDGDKIYQEVCAILNVEPTEKKNN